MLVLVVTGVQLWVGYRPAYTGPAWHLPPELDPAIASVVRGRFVHQWAAKLLVADLLVLAGMGLCRRLPRLAVAALGAVVLAVALAEVGYRLAWQQLALWDVVIGTDIRGIAEVWHPRTRFVVVGGLDGSPEAYRTAALTHVGVATLVLLGLAGLGWRRLWRRRASS